MEILVESRLWISDLFSDFTTKILRFMFWFKKVVLYLCWCCIISSLLVFCLTAPLRSSSLLVRSVLFPSALQFFWLATLRSSIYVSLELAHGNASLLFADGGYNKWNTEIQGERQKSSLFLLTESSATGKGLTLA